MTDRNQFIEDVKRRLDEFKTAPPDEKQYTAYAHFTSLIRDIEKLLDILGIEAIVVTPPPEVNFRDLIHPEDYIDRYGHEAFCTYRQAILDEYIRVGVLNDAKEVNIGAAMLNHESILEQWVDEAESYFAPVDDGRSMEDLS